MLLKTISHNIMLASCLELSINPEIAYGQASQFRQFALQRGRRGRSAERAQDPVRIPSAGPSARRGFAILSPSWIFDLK